MSSRKIGWTMVTLALPVLLSGCAGLGAGGYSEPAPDKAIPFTVEAITPGLVRDLTITPPAAELAPESGSAGEAYVYRIGPSDVLSVFINQSIYSSQQVGQGGSPSAALQESTYVVSENGEIFLPFHGPLKVSGMTMSQAYRAIADALARFITKPQINVRVSEYRSKQVTVVGDVTTPGVLPITDKPMTVPLAVVRAGVKDDSDLRKVVLKRGGKDHNVDVASLIDSPSFGTDWVLQDGDVILVPKNTNKVYVLGEAPNRTELIDPYRSSLAEILVSSDKAARNNADYLQSGTANAGSIFVIRPDADKARVYHLNAKSPESFILASNFQVADGDIVFVSTRQITRFNRFIAQLLPSLQSVLLPLLIVDQANSTN